jgi:anti-anti-sigma regulatory factor
MDPNSGLVVNELAGGVRLVELSGEHDLATPESVRHALAGDRPVIAELTQATFVDSTTLGALFRAASEKMVVIVSPTGTPVRRVLDTVGAPGMLPVVETRLDALGMFGLE